MTREEQIIEASVEFTRKNCPTCIDINNFLEVIREFNRKRAFEAGAKWADQTMLDKVCKWLESELYNTYDVLGNEDIGSCTYYNVEELIENLKEAMKL